MVCLVCSGVLLLVLLHRHVVVYLGNIYECWSWSVVLRHVLEVGHDRIELILEIVHVGCKGVVCIC